MRRIHLMTIKVFTTPRRTPHFEIWRLGSPAACTGDVAVSHLLPPSPFRSPLFLTPLRYLRRIPSPASSPPSVESVGRGYRGGGRPRVSLVPAPPVLHIIYNSRSARSPGNNPVRVRERASRVAKLVETGGERRITRSTLWQPWVMQWRRDPTFARVSAAAEWPSGYNCTAIFYDWSRRRGARIFVIERPASDKKRLAEGSSRPGDLISRLTLFHLYQPCPIIIPLD